MTNIEQMVANLKTAITDIGNAFDYTGIRGDWHNKIEVHVQGVEELNKIDGDITYTPWHCAGHPYIMEASKTVDGVKFFCLLKADEIPAEVLREVN